MHYWVPIIPTVWIFWCETVHKSSKFWSALSLFTKLILDGNCIRNTQLLVVNVIRLFVVVVVVVVLFFVMPVKLLPQQINYFMRCFFFFYFFFFKWNKIKSGNICVQTPPPPPDKPEDSPALQIPRYHCKVKKACACAIFEKRERERRKEKEKKRASTFMGLCTLKCEFSHTY